jgi:predicted amino acid racemase
VFLEATQKYNQDLIEAAIDLHRARRIPPNTYVIDLDSVSENAARIAGAALDHGIGLFAMTKQFGRNPVVARAVADSGIESFVAVSVDEARRLWADGLRVGHVGHLVACSRYDIDEVVDHHPDFVTVYSPEQAEYISAATTDKHLPEQRLLLRMYAEDGFFYAGQAGGFRPGDIEPTWARIEKLDGVSIAGITAHPCLYFSYEDGSGGPTPNLRLLTRAAELLRSMGLEQPVVNAPGVTCCSTLPMLEDNGATYAEPGSALTGSTPLHAFSEQPERPAMVYVTEIAHKLDDRAFVFGGGFYARGHVKEAMVVGDRDAVPVHLAAEPLPAEAIDYYGTLIGSRNDVDSVRVGDTAVYAFRTQIFVKQSTVAVVAGIPDGSPSVIGLFDSDGKPRQRSDDGGAR